MQAAARKVLDENKKLRMLLLSKGMTDQEIEAVMETDESLTRGGTHLLPSKHLNVLVNTRKPCCPDGQPSPTFDLSVAPNSPPQQQQLPPPPPPPLTCRQPSLLPSPASLKDVSSSPIPTMVPTTSTVPFVYPSSPYHQLTTQANELTGQAVSAYSYNYSEQNYWQPYDTPQQQQVVAPDFGNTSCVNAANIIRNMKADVGPELESELGCSEPGVDCKVENTVVFEVMEKYAT
jgi:hypothetical protein